jgi:hypothetical protein
LFVCLFVVEGGDDAHDCFTVGLSHIDVRHLNMTLTAKYLQEWKSAGRKCVLIFSTRTLFLPIEYSRLDKKMDV